MGISLKKQLIKNIADWKEVNITEDFFTKIEAIEMEYKSSKCKFGLKLLQKNKQKEVEEN